MRQSPTRCKSVLGITLNSRDCRSIFLRERDAVQLYQKGGRMVAGDVEDTFFFFFAPRNERYKQI